jgi:hypothetical protein
MVDSVARIRVGLVTISLAMNAKFQPEGEIDGDIGNRIGERGVDKLNQHVARMGELLRSRHRLKSVPDGFIRKPPRDRAWSYVCAISSGVQQRLLASAVVCLSIAGNDLSAARSVYQRRPVLAQPRRGNTSAAVRRGITADDVRDRRVLRAAGGTGGPEGQRGKMKKPRRSGAKVIMGTCASGGGALSRYHESRTSPRADGAPWPKIHEMHRRRHGGTCRPDNSVCRIC